MINVKDGLQPAEQAIAVIGQGTLYDLVVRACHANPYDGRTKQGRAWNDGAWAVMREFEKIQIGAPVVYL